MSLPNDPMMLFSFINMKLRDNYSSLDDLCEDLQVNKKSLLTKLKDAGFEYRYVFIDILHKRLDHTFHDGIQ